MRIFESLLDGLFLLWDAEQDSGLDPLTDRVQGIQMWRDHATISNFTWDFDSPARNHSVRRPRISGSNQNRKWQDATTIWTSWPSQLRNCEAASILWAGNVGNGTNSRRELFNMNGMMSAEWNADGSSSATLGVRFAGAAISSSPTTWGDEQITMIGTKSWSPFNRLDLHINGIEFPSVPTTNTRTVPPDELILNQGTGGNNTRMDVCAVWSRALTIEECDALTGTGGYALVDTWLARNRRRVFAVTGPPPLVFEGTANVTHASQAVISTATSAGPIRSATANVTHAGQTVASTATNVPPKFAADAAVTHAAQTVTAAATFSTGSSGTANLTHAAQAVSAAATSTAPIYSGLASVSHAPQFVTATASFAEDLFVGAANVSHAAQQVTAEATFAPGTYTANALLQHAAQTVVAIAQGPPPIFEDPDVFYPLLGITGLDVGLRGVDGNDTELKGDM